jgi:hypothetical protein
MYLHVSQQNVYVQLHQNNLNLITFYMKIVFKFD